MKFGKNLPKRYKLKIGIKSVRSIFPRVIKTTNDVTISIEKLVSILSKLETLKEGKGGKENEAVFFRKITIPKNRTPFLFPSIFSSGASDAAQFGCRAFLGDCDVTSGFGSPG